ncbi:10783_t:CDS:2, partial [Dentiscutata erythropus]
IESCKMWNALANMAAIVALNNANITAAMINAPDGTLLPALPEKNDMLLGENIYNQLATKTKPKAPFHQDITTEDVDRIVNSRIQALQQSTLNQLPASSSGQENITKADLQAVTKSLQKTMSRATKTLDNSKKSADKRVENTAVIRFLSDLLRKKPYIHPADENNHDPVDDISDSLAGLTLNSVINTAIKRAVKKSSSGHKYSKCRRSDHNSRNCSKRRKGKARSLEK